MTRLTGGRPWWYLVCLRSCRYYNSRLVAFLSFSLSCVESAIKPQLTNLYLMPLLVARFKFMHSFSRLDNDNRIH